MSTARLPTRKAPWRRIIFNPITIKELRATFRQRRFLIVYWVSLAVYSMVVLWLAAIEVGQGNSSGSDPVGQRLFNYCVAAQLALVMFVLPGFAATAVTDERENQSFDLLITTALRAFDIVWGKFLACMGYAFLFLTATFPLVCVSVLFTGVRPGEILFAYAVVAMVAALMVGIGLATSATGRSSRRSVAVTYALGLFACMGWGWLILWLRSAMPSSYSKWDLIGYYYDLVFHESLASTFWTAVVPFVVWAISLRLLFIFAVDRLKPSTANKSTQLRIQGLVVAVTLVAAVTIVSLTTSGTLTGRANIGVFTIVAEAVLLSIFLVCAACEDPRLSRRIQWEYQWASGLKWPLRVFLPGSASGLVYVMLVGAILFGGTLLAVCASANSETPSPAGAASPLEITEEILEGAMFWTIAVLGSMICFYAALGRLFSTYFVGSIYTRTVVIFVFVMANLVPVCLMTLTDQSILGSASRTTEHPSTLWNVHYASAFLSLRSAWNATGYWKMTDQGIFHSKLIVLTWGINKPVSMVSAVIHLGLAAILTVWGWWRQRRVIRPLLKVLYPRSQLTAK